jgi:tRNA threonylcarbamoyladenosine modification (KEOPS) complex Cgi121 subunit
MEVPSYQNFSFELFPKHQLTLFLFDKVKNAPSLIEKLIKFELEMTLLNAEMVKHNAKATWNLFSFCKKVAELDPVLVAANKAIFALETSQMITKNIHSEVVVFISGETNVSFERK